MMNKYDWLYIGILLMMIVVSVIGITRQMERTEMIDSKIDRELFRMSFPLDKYYQEPLFEEVEVEDESCFICKSQHR